MALHNAKVAADYRKEYIFANVFFYDFANRVGSQTKPTQAKDSGHNIIQKMMEILWKSYGDPM